MRGKPPYRVPTMAEISNVKPNGYTAVSTFSGCGGSSLGYRMAGFRMAWANEFIPAARDTYQANCASHTVVDGRDIRDVTANDILTSTGLQRGQLDLFDGSPPCASFSTSGKRHEGWGKTKKYSDVVQRTDDLFFEYARLVEDLQPRVFVAENVSGLIKGTAKGYFIQIMQALRECGYRVDAKLLDAQWLGVPQARQRLIFIGVRNDIRVPPAHPTPLPYRYTFSDIESSRGVNVDPETRHDISISRYAIGQEWEKTQPGRNSDRYFNLARAHNDRPVQTITALGGSVDRASVTHPSEPRKFTLAELRAICGFPPDFILTGTYEQRWERLGRAVPPVMMSHIARTIRDQILNQA